MSVRGTPVGDDFVVGTGAYTTGVLKGQNPYVPNYNGGWTLGTSTNFSVISTGLGAAAPTYEKGGAAELVGTASDAAQYVGRSMTIPTASTYYMSAMLIRGNVPTITPGAYAMVGWGTGQQPALSNSGATLQGIYFGYAQTAATATASTTLDDFGSLVIRARHNVAGVEEVTDTVVADDTFQSTNFVNYFVVAKLEVNTSGNNDTLTYWVNPTTLASEGAMSASCLITGQVTVDAVTAASSLSTQMLAESQMNATIDFDEPRIGTSLADLTVATPTPEPSAIGLGLVALAWRARSRKSR